MEDVISDLEVLMQDVSAPTSNQSTHYLVLDPSVDLTSAESLLQQPVSVVHNDPIILSVDARPSVQLPNTIRYHNTQGSLQLVPSTKLFNQYLKREAKTYNTRTPEAWKSMLTDHSEIHSLCRQYMEKTSNTEVLMEWVAALK